MLKFSDYLKIKDAAKFIGVCPNTLRNWEKEKKLMSYKHPLNGYHIYKKEDLECLLNTITKG